MAPLETLLKICMHLLLTVFRYERHDEHGGEEHYWLMSTTLGALPVAVGDNERHKNNGYLCLLRVAYR